MTPRLKELYKKEILPNIKQKFGFKKKLSSTFFLKILEF